MTDELYVLSLDCERTGQNVPSGPDGALRVGPGRRAARRPNHRRWLRGRPLQCT
jgi:hypothetical protein